MSLVFFVVLNDFLQLRILFRVFWMTGILPVKVATVELPTWFMAISMISTLWTSWNGSYPILWLRCTWTELTGGRPTYLVSPLDGRKTLTYLEKSLETVACDAIKFHSSTTAGLKGQFSQFIHVDNQLLICVESTVLVPVLISSSIQQLQIKFLSYYIS